MKLSEAIRLGAMSKRRARHTLMTRNGRVCALGAAAHAVGELPEKYCPLEINDVYDMFTLRWPMLNHKVPNPTGGDPWNMMWLIIELNDDHNWSRERIADWVESVERARETPHETVSVPALEHAVELGAKR